MYQNMKIHTYKTYKQDIQQEGYKTYTQDIQTRYSIRIVSQDIHTIHTNIDFGYFGKPTKSCLARQSYKIPNQNLSRKTFIQDTPYFFCMSCDTLWVSCMSVLRCRCLAAHIGLLRCFQFYRWST